MRKIKNKELTQYEIYTDGSCKPNPGKGSYGVLIRYNNKNLYLLGGYKEDTTNNRMECYAFYIALLFLKNRKVKNIKIYSDSQYSVKIFNEEYKYKKNIDLWSKILELKQEFTVVSAEWLKGHSSSQHNNKVDKFCDYIRSNNYSNFFYDFVSKVIKVNK